MTLNLRVMSLSPMLTVEITKKISKLKEVKDNKNTKLKKKKEKERGTWQAGGRNNSDASVPRAHEGVWFHVICNSNVLASISALPPGHRLSVALPVCSLICH